MILSDLLLSAWILNTYTEKDQKLYMMTLHLKSKSTSRGTELIKFQREIQSDEKTN